MCSDMPFCFCFCFLFFVFCSYSRLSQSLHYIMLLGYNIKEITDTRSCKNEEEHDLTCKMLENIPKA